MTSLFKKNVMYLLFANICVSILIYGALNRQPIKLTNHTGDLKAVAIKYLSIRNNTEVDLQHFLKTYWQPKNSQQKSQIINLMHHYVHENAKNPIIWHNLGEFYKALGNAELTNHAYFNAQKVANQNLHTLIYLQHQVDTNKGVLDRTGQQRLSVFLTQNPKHEGAYMMMIMHHMQKQHYSDALLYVNRLETVLAQKQNRQSALVKTQQIKSILNERIKMNSQIQNKL